MQIWVAAITNQSVPLGRNDTTSSGTRRPIASAQLVIRYYPELIEYTAVDRQLQ